MSDSESSERSDEESSEEVSKEWDQEDSGETGEASSDLSGQESLGSLGDSLCDFRWRRVTSWFVPAGACFV